MESVQLWYRIWHTSLSYLDWGIFEGEVEHENCIERNNYCREYSQERLERDLFAIICHGVGHTHSNDMYGEISN